jgi:predicted nucleic-acid-binding Zn-ribbon protein
VRTRFHRRASEVRNDDPRLHVITCKRCGGVSQRVATLPKRFENAAYEVFQCLKCEFVDWVQRD